MNTLLQKVVEMSLYGSVAILLVILFRMLFYKYSKKLTLLFWVIVAIRLICPFNFSSSLSLMNLLPSRTQTEEHRMVQEENANKVQIRVRAKEGVSTNTPKTVDKSASDIDSGKILFTLWAGGTAVLLCYAGIRYFKVRRFVNGCRKSSDGLYLESDKTDTPFVAGVFKPHICIPSHIENNEREYLLLHEQTHIKNHDGIIKTFGFLVVCIHWFNPLVWLSYVMLCSDLEMRCDEEVIEKLGKDIKKDYCRSIIMHSLREPLAMPGNTAFSGFGLGALEVKMRINNLLRYKKISKVTSALVLCATIGLTAVLTACKEEVTAPSASDTSTSETAVSEVTTSETEGTTTVSETEGTDVNTTFHKTVESGDVINTDDITSIIESLEDEGYSFEGITGAMEDEDSGTKNFIIVDSDGKLQTIFVDEDGTVTLNGEDLLVEFEDKLESVDLADFDETLCSDSNVVVYSFEFTDGAYDVTEDYEEIIDYDFPIAIAQG